MSDRYWYWVRMPKNWKGPAKVVTCLQVGAVRQPIQFNKNQVDKSAGDYPRKKLFLDEESAQVFKASGYEVRKAKAPKPSPPRPRQKLKRRNDDE